MRRARVAAVLGILIGLPLLADGARAATPSARPWPRFAPYSDFAGYPPPDLSRIRAGSGARAVTLGFVVAQGATACTPSWGGYATYPATGTHAYRRAQVRAFTRKGGQAIPSFGGSAGTELATVCPTASALTDAYGAVAAAYGATRLDFDIEGAAVADRATNARRAQAIALLQRRARAAGRRLDVAYTLPVLPTGLDANGRAVVRAVKAGGVALTLVNVMAMDYGDSAAPSPAGRMGTYAIAAATATRRQLARVYPRRSTQALFAMVGVTPMLGINDVETEVFGLDDAQRLATWAAQSHVGMLGLWQAGRDRACARPVTSAQIDCSGVTQEPWAFSRALGAYAG